MDIKFLELLIDENGKRSSPTTTEALFEVGESDIKIGVTDKFLHACKSANPRWTAELFLKEFGKLMIQKMLIENNVSDYVFKAHNFLKGNDCMSLEEIKEKLENDIMKAEEKQNSIGFKI
ncbi:hypothetical protein COZ78_03050 [bacterium (Candidatus Gribaldobacteria) CG_4_8_14_3_um_filter_42_11]|uniref:Uncharacterized protein n=1 Tax=bacterium (Candidatus Gribaldobacteria) CG_4_8_14_3_um_filter_42_11 TaxID=2014267 RepID=A0A2M7IXK9_9BACT|nr:MAG: hypothetical protein COZ78_03050 [bacterium (Candidatus Gribaldobacteria) CG_4_8_14_3_um_filter_42_11]